jgi:acetyltransferase-like isoleucine patch superfamily enzyme
MKLGDFSYSDGGIKVITDKSHNTDLIIGKFCSIAYGVTVFLGNNHRTEWISTYPFGHTHQNTFNKFNGEGHPSTKGSVIIGNDVYIGTSAVIMSGVTIGDGAVIGASSVVTKDVPPYTIYAGNPAIFKKKRFSDADIQFLLDLKWWDMENNVINEISSILCSGDMQKLKDYFKK